MKLTITTEFTVWCQRCQVWEQYSLNRKIEAEQVARAGGWGRRKKKTCCPKCVNELDRGIAWDKIGYRPNEQ